MGEETKYVVQAFRRGLKRKELGFLTIKDAHAYVAYLGSTFDCVILAKKAARLRWDFMTWKPALEESIKAIEVPEQAVDAFGHRFSRPAGDAFSGRASGR